MTDAFPLFGCRVHAIEACATDSNGRSDVTSADGAARPGPECDLLQKIDMKANPCPRAMKRRQQLLVIFHLLTPLFVLVVCPYKLKTP